MHLMVAEGPVMANGKRVTVAGGPKLKAVIEVIKAEVVTGAGGPML